MRGALFLWLAWCASLFGQVTNHEPLVIDQYKLGVVKSETPEQTDTTQSIVAWKPSSPAIDYHLHGDEVCLTAPPGAYTLTQEITTITVDWEAKRFTLTQATHVTPITVQGQPGPPPPPPPPPIPVTKGLCWTVIIRQTDTMTVDQSVVLSDFRQWTDSQPTDKVAHWEFAPDAIGDPKILGYVSKIPSDKRHPYAFICQADAAGKSQILWQGELPATANELIERVKGAIQ